MMPSYKPTLLASFEDGEGRIGNLRWFMTLDPLTRCDLLGDWIGDLNDLYAKSYEDLMEHWTRLREKALKESADNSTGETK